MDRFPLLLTPRRAMACIVAISVMLFAPVLRAAPLTWTLAGVDLGDGGGATGQFDYDAATNTFSSIAIMTTPGTVRPGATYSTPTGVGNAQFPDFIDPPLPIIVGQSQRFSLFLADPMTDAGGTIDVLFASEITCIDAFACTFVTGDEPGLNLRFGQSGLITTEPERLLAEPSSLAAFGGILLAWAAASRRWQRRR